jgi:exonuclease VII small subunit
MSEVNLMTAWVNSFEGLMDFLSLVIVHAPDEFPKEDYLRDEEQLTLDMAFAELRQGMQFVEKRIHNQPVIARLQSLLDESLAAYREGDDLKGAHLLQDFESMVIENNK